MTTIDRFERELPDALDDIAGTRAPDYLSDILGRTARTRQRPAWASIERWLPMDFATPRAATARVPWRTIAVLALIVLLVAASLVLVAGGRRRVPPPFGTAANGVIPYSLDGDIFIGDPVTGKTRLILGGPEVDRDPGFSSDGTLIGVIRRSPAGGDDLVVFDEQGRSQRTINSEPLRNMQYAQWVPGRHEILATHDVDGRQHLEAFDADGSPPRLLLDGANVTSAAYRPPLGDELLVSGRIDGTWGLHLLRPDGTRKVLAKSTVATADQDPQGDMGGATYSPDGRRIYFNHHVDGVDGMQVWVMDADGSDPHRFNASGPTCCWWEGSPSPSPDGKWVLMIRYAPEGVGGGGLTLYPADGSGGGTRVGPPGSAAQWFWSPDATRILVIMDDAAGGGDWLIDPVTGVTSRLPWQSTSSLDWQRTLK